MSGLNATGVQIHDRHSGNDYGLCDLHAEQWQRDYPDEFTNGFDDARLVIIGPMFADPSTWECPACAAAARAAQ